MSEQKGLYIATKWSQETVYDLMMIQQELKLKNPIPKEEFHTTIIYSSKWADVKVLNVPYLAGFYDIAVWKTQEDTNAVVLLLISSNLEARHKNLMKKYDLDYGHPQYQPHITLSYDEPDFDMSKDYKSILSKYSIFQFADGEYSESINNQSD